MAKGMRAKLDEKGFCHDWYARLYPEKKLAPTKGEKPSKYKGNGWGPDETSELLNYPQWLRDIGADEKGGAPYEECKICGRSDSLVLQNTCTTCLDEDNLLTE